MTALLILATHESGRQAQGAALVAMAVVLFAAIIGIIIFLRRETRQRRQASAAEPQPEPEPEPKT